jgi:glycosyltransferase involved in cell wall biosynthesis
VKFIDQISKEELPYYYAASDIVLVTLRDLPLFKCVIPSKIFEIMAMNKPILINVSGEAQELVVSQANAGWAVPPENSVKLAEKITELINNTETSNSLGENGRKFVEKNFDRNKLADSYLELIRQVVDQKDR